MKTFSVTYQYTVEAGNETEALERVEMFRTNADYRQLCEKTNRLTEKLEVHQQTEHDKWSLV